MTNLSPALSLSLSACLTLSMIIAFVHFPCVTLVKVKVLIQSILLSLSLSLSVFSESKHLLYSAFLSHKCFHFECILCFFLLGEILYHTLSQLHYAERFSFRFIFFKHLQLFQLFSFFLDVAFSALSLSCLLSLLLFSIPFLLFFLARIFAIRRSSNAASSAERD